MLHSEGYIKLQIKNNYQIEIMTPVQKTMIVTNCFYILIIISAESVLFIKYIISPSTVLIVLFCSCLTLKYTTYFDSIFQIPTKERKNNKL